MSENLTKQFTFPANSAGDSSKVAKNSAFVILYTREVSLWENHQEKPKAVREDKSPAFLMVRRSDYMMGFPGGGLKADETPLDGAIQELKEELGITFLDRKRLELLSNQQFKNVRGVECKTNCFIAELSADEFKSVLQNSHKAEHFMAETRGLIPVSMEHTSPEKPLPFQNFLHSPMSPSVRQDISDFLVHTEIIKPAIMRHLIKAELLPLPKERLAQPSREHNLS